MNIDILAKEIADLLSTQSEHIARVHKPNNKAALDHSYSIMGYYYKRSVLIELEPWGMLRIKLDCNNTLLFSISKKGFADFFNFFGGRRISTGDVRFDQILAARGYDRRKLASWLMNKEVRDAILSLAPFKCFDFRENLLQYMIDIDFDAVKTYDIIEKIKTLDRIALSLERIQNE